MKAEKLRVIPHWFFYYLVPAIVTGLVFASVLGRYTTETQFAQAAFQNYLRPYEIQYRSCLETMQGLRDRWQNIDAIYSYASSSVKGDGGAPILVYSVEGIIGETQGETTTSLEGKLVVSSRRSGVCIEESARQARELAILLGLEQWFQHEESERAQRMNEYRQAISETWTGAGHIDQFDLTNAAIKIVNEGGVLSIVQQHNAIKYLKAIEKFRALLLDIHDRDNDWFEALDEKFSRDLSERTSRKVGFYLRYILGDIFTNFSFLQPAVKNETNTTSVWAKPINKSPPPVDCSCRIPDGLPFGRLGDPP